MHINMIIISEWDPVFSIKDSKSAPQSNSSGCEELRREQVKAARNMTPVNVVYWRNWNSFMINPFNQFFLSWTKRKPLLTGQASIWCEEQTCVSLEFTYANHIHMSESHAWASVQQNLSCLDKQVADIQKNLCLSWSPKLEML